MRTVLLKLQNYFISTVRSTDDNEWREMHDVINGRLSTSTHIAATPDIIKQCIHKLKLLQNN